MAGECRYADRAVRPSSAAAAGADAFNRVLPCQVLWPDVLVGPSAVHLDHVRSLAKPLIAVAAQNCYVEATGAFTGENRYGRATTPT